MLTELRVVRDSAARVQRAVDQLRQAYAEDWAEQEPELTGRLAAYLESALDEFTVNGFTWRAKSVPGINRTDEKRTGADLLGVLVIDLPWLKIKKGFLVQSKRLEPNRVLSKEEFKRLQGQCERMLALSPDAFVWVYSRREGVRAVPAISVAGLTENTPLHDLYTMKLTTFFRRHFESFIGDRNIQSPSVDALESTARQFNVRHALALQLAKPLGDSDG